MAAASPTPVRYPSGVSTDNPFQPLSAFGLPNPMKYNVLMDDFDLFPATPAWTKTVNTNGTVAAAAGDGGTILFTTNSSTPLATDICSIQAPAACFKINGGVKKVFFMTRIKMADVTNGVLLAGLIQTTTTPFTVTDGVWFSKATGAANNLAINTSVSSTAVATTIPTSAYTLSNDTYIDLAFYIDRNGDLFAYVDSDLVAYIPQSGTGSTTPNRGAVARVVAPSLPTANLNPTLALQSGTTASTTMTADFIFAAKER